LIILYGKAEFERKICEILTESQKRLEHRWYITVAVRGGCIVGHAEWIFDRERNGEYLYLDELQVITHGGHNYGHWREHSQASQSSRPYAGAACVTYRRFGTGNQQVGDKRGSAGHIAADSACKRLGRNN
jgi:hypothetical protein